MEAQLFGGSVGLFIHICSHVISCLATNDFKDDLKIYVFCFPVSV